MTAIEPSEHQVDLDLVDEANRGDSQAMKALYFRHRDWVYGQAYRVCENEDDALDVVQEVFIYFFAKFPGFELRSQLKTFLYPVARNISLNLIKKQRRVVPLERRHTDKLTNGSPPPSSRVGFYDMISRLPEDGQEILLLRFAEDFSLQQIAETLSIPLGTAKSRLHRALTQLRAKFD